MITVRELDGQNVRDVNKCDGSFTVDSRGQKTCKWQASR